MNVHSPRTVMVVLAISTALGAALVARAQEPGEVSIPLKDAKLNIEHNATDNDTGFQGFIDSEGWKQLDVTGPKASCSRLEGRGELGSSD